MLELMDLLPLDGILSSGIGLDWFNENITFMNFSSTVLIILILVMVLMGEPLYVLLGALTLYLLLTIPTENPTDNSTLRLLDVIGAFKDLANKTELLAIPFFVLAGAIMTAGDIARRLVTLAQAAFGWLPGGLAISGVMACVFFAAISGSSPVTVIAIGTMMFPVMQKEGYPDHFSSGLLTSAGSLGILIPPSIPMLIYAIVLGQTQIGWAEPFGPDGQPAYGVMLDDPVTALFMAGVGPGLLIATIFIGYSLAAGVRFKVNTVPFKLEAFLIALRDGFWSLMLPILLLGGIYSGLFSVTKAAGVAVIYSFCIEVFLHRGLKLNKLPRVFGESAVLMGSILIIIAMAMGFNLYLESARIPDEMVDMIASYDLDRYAFLLLINVLLIIVGCLMDIMSAILILVPLLGPLGMELGIHPVHLAIIFIVNLEIGYLTPPLGLNLFVASSIFKQPIGKVITSVLPFMAMMLGALMLITFVPAISLAPLAIKKGVDPFMGFQETITPKEAEKINGEGLNSIMNTSETIDEVLDASGNKIEISPEIEKKIASDLESSLDEARRKKVILTYPKLGEPSFMAMSVLISTLDVDDERGEDPTTWNDEASQFIDAGIMDELLKRHTSLGDEEFQKLIKVLYDVAYDGEERAPFFKALPTYTDAQLKSFIKDVTESQIFPTSFP